MDFIVEDLEQLPTGKWAGRVVLELPGLRATEFTLNLADFRKSGGKWGLRVKRHPIGSDGDFATREALKAMYGV